MGYIEVYIDSSYRAKDGASQSGCIFYISGEWMSFSSDVFVSGNCNDAEILGCYYIIKDIYENYNVNEFKLFNDNMVACNMLDHSKKTTDRVLKDHHVLEFVVGYFKKKNIIIETEHIGRKHEMMKKCDRLSKVFQRGEYGVV